MVALVMAGFVVLSTFVPSVQACSMVAVLVHFTMFLFLSSEFLVILFADFLRAMTLPLALLRIEIRLPSFLLH